MYEIQCRIIKQRLTDLHVTITIYENTTCLGHASFLQMYAQKFPFNFLLYFVQKIHKSPDLIRENRNFSVSESCTQFLKLLSMKLPASEFCVDNDKETFPSVQDFR